MILSVTPNEAIRLQDAAMKAGLTIDGSFNEKEWDREVRAIFGDAVTDRMRFAGPIQVDVQWNTARIEELDRLR